MAKFGTMTLGDKGTGGNRISDLSQAQEIIHIYNKHSGKELDTARAYCDGTTEEMLSRLDIKGNVVDTKCYPVKPGDHEPAKLRASLEKSLKALKTDKVRVFYLHAPDRATPFEDTLREMDKLHKEGKFTQFGLSNFKAFETAEICTICRKEGLIKPTIYQGMYNAITRNVEAELFSCLRKFGLRFVAYNPLAGGFFAGKVQSSTDQVETGGRFDASTKQGENYRKRYFRDVYFKALEHVKSALEGTDVTLIGAALRWMEHHSQLTQDDGIIIGASSAAQLEENMKQLEAGPLPDNVVQALDEAWLMTKADAPDYWR